MSLSNDGVCLPRVTIRFCTQCKWMLRAAYYAQELLSTFSLALGEVALQPSTGGTFIVTIEHPQVGQAPQQPVGDASQAQAEASPKLHPPPPLTTTTVLWDRRVHGGFPETKELKRRVRDVIEPGRDLGHVDRHDKQPVDVDAETKAKSKAATPIGVGGEISSAPDGNRPVDRLAGGGGGCGCED